jgi:hypothetical protein
MSFTLHYCWLNSVPITAGYGVVSYKASHIMRPLSYLICVLFWVLIIPDWSTELSGIYKQRHLVPNREKISEKWQWILPTKYLFHGPQGSLTCRKIFEHGNDGFTAPPNEVVMRIFIALKSIALGRVWTRDIWVQNSGPRKNVKPVVVPSHILTITMIDAFHYKHININPENET